jgi:hypothetical protein
LGEHVSFCGAEEMSTGVLVSSAMKRINSPELSTWIRLICIIVK